jgi:hypothetical protein
VSKETEPTVVLITVDRATSSTVFTRSDGKEARFPLRDSPFEDTSTLSRLHFTPAVDGLLAVTRAGDEIALELPRRNDDGQLAGRLIVYLDQNQWSTLDEALHDGAGGGDENRDVALQLADWVKKKRIVLPASAGHYYETTKRFDIGKRYRLGVTVLQLSRGWQMHDPLQVRRDELQAALRRRLAHTVGKRNMTVFTLAPNVIYSAVRGTEPYMSPPDFPPDAAFRLEPLTSATSQIDAMLDTERIEPGADSGWTAANQQFSDWLDGENRDSQQKRKAIDAFLLTDLQTEIADEAHALGVPLEQFRHWMLRQATEDIRHLPALGLFREMLHDRHLNRGTVWKPNDLTDMIYLSCAAGYADFVVTERHMGSVLTQGVKRLDRPTQVFRRLGDAVKAIKGAMAISQARTS